MSEVTKGSITSSFPASITSITAQDESNDPASEDTTLAEARDFNKLGAELQAVQGTLGIGGRGEVFNVLGDPTHTFSVGSFRGVYQGTKYNFGGATGQALTNGQDNYIYLVPSGPSLAVSTSGFPATEHIPLARWDDSGGSETFTDERTADFKIVNEIIEDHASNHIHGGIDEMDADKAAISYAPSNYTRTTSPSEVDDVEQLTAHLAGIDNALTGVSNHGSTHIDGGADPIDFDKGEISWTPTNYINSALLASEVDQDDQLTAHLAGIDFIIPDFLTIEGGAYWAELVRTDADTLTLQAKARSEAFIEVNDEFLDVSFAIDCAVGASADNTIASTGLDSGSPPSGPGLFNVFVSNASATAAEELRLSTTAVDDFGYLDGTSEAVHWRFVGAVYLDASEQIVATWNVCGIMQEHIDTSVLASDANKNTGSTAYEDIITLSNVVVLQGTSLTAHTTITNSKTTAGDDTLACKLIIDTDEYHSALEIRSDSEPCSQSLTGQMQATSIDEFTVKCQYNYETGGDYTVKGTATGLEKTWLTIKRSTVY